MEARLLVSCLFWKLSEGSRGGISVLGIVACCLFGYFCVFVPIIYCFVDIPRVGCLSTVTFVFFAVGSVELRANGSLRGIDPKVSCTFAETVTSLSDASEDNQCPHPSLAFMTFILFTHDVLYNPPPIFFPGVCPFFQERYQASWKHVLFLSVCPTIYLPSPFLRQNPKGPFHRWFLH